jgi:plastocyanin
MVRRYVIVACILLGVSVSHAAERSIGQKGRLFSPGILRVKSGEAVVFKNDDSVTHHVYSATKGHEFDLTTAKPGQDVRHTFSKSGRVEVRCGLHPGMRLVVTVE